ncbi:hypothetical protein R3P38DRAFT_3263025 [Favolaschia claudopus]|uniref:Uncharacterized protein n=1 Tax=Favolaschia claudopus TaxID=2862362 RepID=A0AAW0CD27_9AGAR
MAAVNCVYYTSPPPFTPLSPPQLSALGIGVNFLWSFPVLDARSIPPQALLSSFRSCTAVPVCTAHASSIVQSNSLRLSSARIIPSTVQYRPRSRAADAIRAATCRRGHLALPQSLQELSAGLL